MVLRLRREGMGLGLYPVLDFRLSKLGSEGRHWNNEKSGSRSRSELDSGSERRLELDPSI